MDRTVAWDGVFNARDLGGLRTGNGTTAFGSLYRAPRLECLTDSGWQQLGDAGVRTVIDLRNDGERDRRDTDPVVDAALLPAVTTVHCPTEDQSDPEFMELFGQYLSSPEYYAENLRRWPDKIARVFRALAEAPAGGIVIHCSAGRDRTGMITMMVLLLAEVSPEDILDDYALSVRAMNEHFRTSPHPKEPALSESDLQDALMHRTAALTSVMEELDVRQYLLDAGLSLAELESVRRRLAP